MNSDHPTGSAANIPGAQTREYQERLERYRQDFLQVIGLEFPPGQELRQGLRQLQQSLGLGDADVEAIEAQVSHDFDIQKRAYHEYLYRYEQEFSEAIRQEYPLSSANQDRLWRMKEDFGLQSADVIRIEGQVLSQYGNRQRATTSSPPVQPPFPEPLVLSPKSPTESQSLPSPQTSDSQPSQPDPQDFRLPHPLESRLVDDINLDSLTTSAPFSTFADASTTHLPRSQFADATLQSQPNLQPNLQAQTAIPITQLDPPSLRSDVGIDYTNLHDLLEANQWERADDETLAVLLQASGRNQEGWLDAMAIANLPCTDLQTIDRLWGRYSNEQFSFRVQYRMYSGVTISPSNAVQPSGSDAESALNFVKAVGWWTKRLEFLKYYNQLDFSLQAPDGHLPALWFWTIPWSEALKFGGIGSGRGGCRVDDKTLTAFMDRLKQCGIE